MKEEYHIRQNLYVRCSMFTSDELRRQKRLGLNKIDKDVLDGLIKQKSTLESQQTSTARTLIIFLFLSFVSWKGGNFKIPGTGATIEDIPAFLEISLIISSFSVLFISYLFLSIHLYSAMISATAQTVMAEDKLDTDIFVASREPMWLFIKYARNSPVNGRSPGYVISKLGSAYNYFLVSSASIVISISWFLSIFCILYLCHVGLSDSFAGWIVYAFCILLIFISITTMLAMHISFKTKLDFEHLEHIESNNFDS